MKKSKVAGINNSEFLRRAFARRQGARMELTAHWSNKHKINERNLRISGVRLCKMTAWRKAAPYLAN